MKKIIPSLAGLLMLVGCVHGQPSAFERTIYDVRTQVVAVVTLQTNFVLAPGTTNMVPVGVSPITNYAETYQYHPKESVITGIQTGGQIATTFGFGLGGVIASLLLGAYGAWATWSNNRKAKLNTVMAQGTQLARETILATAGAATEAQFVDAIASAQVKAGVKEDAIAVVDSKVDEKEAKLEAASVVSLAKTTPSTP